MKAKALLLAVALPLVLAIGVVALVYAAVLIDTAELNNGQLLVDGQGRRLVATRANGQPAFGLYVITGPDPRGRSDLRITRFETSLLPYFRLSRTMPDERGGPGDQSD